MGILIRLCNIWSVVSWLLLLWKLCWLFFSYFSGKNVVWCLYPNKSAVSKSAQEAFGQESSADKKCTQMMVLFFFFNISKTVYMLHFSLLILHITVAKLELYFWIIMNLSCPIFIRASNKWFRTNNLLIDVSPNKGTQ